MIASLTALAICAVVCSWTVAQEGPAQRPHAIAWESSVVRSTGEKIDESTEPANPTIEWPSDTEPNDFIPPNAEKPASSPSLPPIRTHVEDTAAALGQASHSVLPRVNVNDRAEKIATTAVPAESAMKLIYPSNFERPVQERGPELQPFENYPLRITNPTVAPNTSPAVAQPNIRTPSPAQPKFAQPNPIELSVTQPNITLPNAKVPVIEGTVIEEPAIELLPPTTSSQADSNDFPINSASRKVTEPAKPASPFQLASTRKKAQTQSLPDLPPLPGQSKGSDSKTAAAKTRAKKKKKAPGVLESADAFVLAAQPEAGDHYYQENPQIDARAWKSESYLSDFSPDPIDVNLPADPWAEIQVYEGKTLNANQRPLVELGRPWYQLGPLSPGSSVLGFHNNLTPQFLVYGDFRSVFASNQLGGNSVTRTAVELNLDIDLKLTATERFHAFVSPLDNGQENTGFLFDDDEFIDQFDAQIDFGYFEGDLGAIVGGAIGKTLPFDLPFTIGEIPLVFQNGIWLEDAFLGFAATIPARNSARFDISNMDITFFAGYDQINSDAFPGDNSAAKVYGVASFIEANNGFWEIDYAFLEDRTFDDRSYHNIGIGFTRRYGRLLSNSTRIIVNAGQSTDQVENTADGVLLLSENSLITGSPLTVVPYLNFFAGFDRPQSVARAAQSGGILRNTGILFESDGTTGFPTLDATANDTFGMALGLNLLPNDFSQQLVVEAAFLGVMGDDANRNAQGDQYGLGVRYQLPLTNAIIFRSDAMIGFRRGDEDINGFRMELRHKF